MKIKVEEYICLNGSNPYKAWFDDLDPQAAAKMVMACAFGVGEYISREVV